MSVDTQQAAGELADEELAGPDVKPRLLGHWGTSPGLAVRAAAVRQRREDVRLRHHDRIREHGVDLPEVADWTWEGSR
ncbi:hypothetical protein [Streptomyces sp. AC512_CC834]|uniref:hypothetical protein n=1 Tax=Streptomyces sp. AC512_CC834 TaxID=2823691 RepID=UPI001C26EFD2|nr:hypothetical protein [Streptomyces sp. AC512_CC834]